MPASPDAVGTVTESASVSTTFFSGVTISNLSIVTSDKSDRELSRHLSLVTRNFLGRSSHFLRLFAGLLDGADHVERLFGHVVALAFENFAKAFDRVFRFDVFAL